MKWLKWLNVFITKQKEIKTAFKEVMDVQKAYKIAKADDHVSKTELKNILDEFDQAVSAVLKVVDGLL